MGGLWSYRHTVSAPTIETWKHGTARKHEESKTDTWTWAVEESVSAGFAHYCPGGPAGFGVAVTVTGKQAWEVSNYFSNEWSTHEEMEFSVEWSEEDVGKAIWQFVFTHVDTCQHEENTVTQEFAKTMNGKDEPCCLPGFFADDPSYKVCLSEAAMIPNWQ